jgi:uncharacterized protein YrzB (UPF0473 family)
MTEDIKNTEAMGEEEIQVFTLTDENGVESDFELLLSMDIEGVTYMALVPVSENEEGEYVILKLAEEDGEDVLLTIDDDDEFERIADIFDEELFGEIDHDVE